MTQQKGMHTCHSPHSMYLCTAPCKTVWQSQVSVLLASNFKREQFNMQEFRRRGLRLIGFSFDGDSRLRRAMYDLLRDATIGAPVESMIKIDHPIMELHAVHPFRDKQMAIMCFSDWLHIVFRLRRQMLESGRRLDIGGMLVTLQPLRQMASNQIYRVSKSDMDFANKQCFEGGSRIPACI